MTSTEHNESLSPESLMGEPSAAQTREETLTPQGSGEETSKPEDWDLRLEFIVESIVFAAKEPLKVQEIREIVGDPSVRDEDIQAVLDDLIEHYDTRKGGFKLVPVKRLGYQFQTSPRAAPIMEKMFASRPRPITRAALETLAIIAYRQPVTRAEIEFIRGVDAGSIIKTLMDREMVKCVGRKEIVGRPMMFGTTDEFLKVFSLSHVKDLPPLESFQPSRDAMTEAQSKIREGQDQVDIEDIIAKGVYESEAETLSTESPDGFQGVNDDIDKKVEIS